MLNFIEFLIESNKHPRTGKFQSPDRHFVMSFMRANPPHVGHLAVVKKVRSVADSLQADHAVILSHSFDKKKNPLNPHRKIQYAKSLFPKGTNVQLSSKVSPNLISQARDYNKKGYNHLHVVVGSDRQKEFTNMLSKYNGKEYNYRSITVHSAGNRAGPGSIPVSASAMRAAASKGNQEEFSAGLPKQYPKRLAKSMMSDVSRGLK